MEPGAANADTTVAGNPPPNVIGRFKGVPGLGVIAPVACGNGATPRPSRKICTSDPGSAGFVQEFLVPSALNASGIGPPLYCAPFRRQFDSDERATPSSRNAAGLIATMGRVCESERLSCVSANAMLAWVAPAISNGACTLICRVPV
jgi:hypothetical protein